MSRLIGEQQRIAEIEVLAQAAVEQRTRLACRLGDLRAKITARLEEDGAAQPVR